MVGPKTPIFFIDFQKMPQDFLKKQNLRGSAAQIFFSLVVEKTLKNVPRYAPSFLPLPENEANQGKVVKANHV